MYHITLPYKEVIYNIEWKFNNYVVHYKQPFSDKEGIYIRAFRHYLVLCEYGILPEKAAQSFDELNKLHLGYTLGEINDLSIRLAKVDMNEVLKIETDELTEAEMKAITEYHKILFGKFTKKENPFEH